MTSPAPMWTRTGALEGFRQDFDVLVVGGGITGAGSALDLAARGLSVALVEQADFAQGTSSRSTKLLHGGVRYLPQMHFSLIAEGLREQKILARTADFLYEPLEFVIPVYDQHGIADAPAWASEGRRATLALRAGLTVYDLLGGVNRPGNRHRKLTAAELLEMVPALRPEGLQGGFVYADAQTDDARLVVAVLKTAVRSFGAVAAGRLRVDRLIHLDPGYRAEITDLESSEDLTVTARAVLSATGAFAPPGIDVDHTRLELVRSKGTHLLVASGDLPLSGRALVLPETDDGRLLYVVPWLGHSMIGTTDTRYESDLAHPTASPEEVAYLLRHVSQYLDVGDLRAISSFAGLRALADGGAGSTASASREHKVAEPIPGYVQVAGGKLTTYRRIAAEAADAVASGLGITARSDTAAIPLVGSGGDHAQLARRLADAGVAPGAVEPTIARYGTEAEVLARMIDADPKLARPLGDGRSSLADAAYAVRHEAATTISDITLRRTHTAWFTADHARSDAPRIASVMAGLLGWSAGRVDRELQAHEAELVAEGL